MCWKGGCHFGLNNWHSWEDICDHSTPKRQPLFGPSLRPWFKRNHQMPPPIFVGGPKEFQTYRSTLPRVVFCLLKLGPLAPIPRRLLDCLWSSLSPKKKGSPLIQATWIPSSQSSIATSKGKFPKYGSTHKITSNFVYHAMIQVSTYAQGKPFIIWLRPCQIQGNHLRNFSTKYNISILYIYIMPLTSLPNHIHYFKE